MIDITLSVVVPVFNEATSITPLLRAVLDSPVNKEIVVVDDGSTDGTREIVEDFQSQNEFRILIHDRNRGKGAAVRTAIEHATGELLIVQDGDLEYDPNEYSKLIRPILSGKADVVYGSRRLDRRTNWARLLTPFYHGVSVLNLLVRLLYGKKLTDEATCYKVFFLKDLKRMELECERFEFCPEVTAKACRMGLRIVEVPINYTPRSVSEGKKIGFKDAVEAAMTLWKHRNWNPENSPDRSNIDVSFSKEWKS